ncbi:MAG: hemolysin family protein [Bacteroidota bacterium]
MLILGIVLLLILSAIFSGTEIAFVSASKLQVELKKNKGGKRGEVFAHFFDRPGRFLSTMLVGNNIALVTFSLLCEVLLQKQLPIESKLAELLIYTLITTVVVLIFGEFLPKTIFRLFANQILYALTYPLRVIQILLIPISWIMVQLSNQLIKLFISNPKEEVEEVVTRLDLENFIKSTTASDEEEEIDTQLFENALHLRDVRVKECMIPRNEIEYIDVTASIEALEEKIKDTQLSRIVVTQNNDIDDVLGYVHHQKLLFAPQHILPVVVTEMPIVPETMQAQDLMNQFIKKRISLACVVDEYGGTAGIVALEDILEELFGEIEDEHDIASNDYIETQISEREFLLSGRLEIDYLNDKYDVINFPEGDFHTLSGYIVMTREMIPEEGEAFELDGYHFILESVSNTKIESVRVIVPKVEE